MTGGRGLGKVSAVIGLHDEGGRGQGQSAAAMPTGGGSVDVKHKRGCLQQNI